MKKKKEKLAQKYRVADGKGFKLKDFDPGDTDGWDSKEHAAKELQEGVGARRNCRTSSMRRTNGRYF